MRATLLGAEMFCSLISAEYRFDNALYAGQAGLCASWLALASLDCYLVQNNNNNNNNN